MVREEVGRETETQTETEAERWRQENTPLWPLIIMTLSRTGGGGGLLGGLLCLPFPVFRK